MEYLNFIKEKGNAVIEDLKKAMAGIRTGRPSPALLEEIKVSYYDQMVPMKQVGSIGVQPPRELFVQVWDKTAIPGIVKAIETSSLNVSANVDGNVIRVFLPELSAERREELMRHAKKIGEDHRIEIRHIRDEAMKQVQEAFNAGDFGEDQKFKTKESIQKEVDRLNSFIEEVLEKKMQEISE